MPATFVVGRGRGVAAGVATTIGDGDGDAVGEAVGVGEGVSGAIVAVGDGLGRATGGCSRAVSARPAPITRINAIATPLATFMRNGI